MNLKGWKVDWVETRSGFQSREVFTSPEGVEYLRTPTPELAEITVTEWKHKGLKPLYLKRRDSTTAHLHKQAPPDGGVEVAA